MKPKTEKAGIAFMCTLGVCFVAYGMIKENDSVFIIGLLLVIAGYLFVRKKLKNTAQNKS